MNIVLLGFMGTGKSIVGKKLASKLDYSFIDLDDEIVTKAGKSIPEIFAETGEDKFRDLESQVVKEVSDRDELVIATGGGVVLRDENVEYLKDAGILILLEATAEEILARTKDDDNRPLLQVADPLAKINNLLAQRADKYDCTKHKIDTTSLEVEEVVAEILETIKKQSN